MSSEQSTEQPPCRAGWRRCHHTGGQADGGEARGSGSSPPPGAGRRPPPSSNRWVMPQERVTAFPGVLASGKRPQRARLHRDGRQVVEDSSGRALRGGRWQPGRPERRLTFCPGPRLRASRCPKGRDLEEPAQLRAGQGPAAAWTPCGLWRPYTRAQDTADALPCTYSRDFSGRGAGHTGWADVTPITVLTARAQGWWTEEADPQKAVLSTLGPQATPQARWTPVMTVSQGPVGGQCSEPTGHLWAHDPQELGPGGTVCAQPGGER